MALDGYIRDARRSLGYESLKEKQKEAIIKFILGRDVFVALPTGYRKSFGYCSLSHVFDGLKSADKRMSIVLVVSLLVMLMKDQVALCCSIGLYCYLH